MATPAKAASAKAATGGAPTGHRLTMVEALNRAFFEEMERDPRIVVLGEDVGVDGGVFRVTKGLQDRFGKERVVDTPLAEFAIAAAGVGLALGGMVPVCEMQFSGFMNYAYGSLQPHSSRFLSRTRGVRGVPMVVRAPSGGAIRALEHHSESEEASYVSVPGLVVVMPSGPTTAYGLLKAALRSGEPVIFFEPKSIYRAFREEVPEDGPPLPLGKCLVDREGADLTLVSWGGMVRRCREAADAVAHETGASIEILDLVTLAPLDVDTIAASVRKTGRIVVVHEAPRTGGYAGEIITRACEEGFFHLRAQPRRVTSFDVPYPLFARENAYLPDMERIVAALKASLAEG
jgi:pyruvate/2-oxoglutarate/acetoin dehydrogenase E1 component